MIPKIFLRNELPYLKDLFKDNVSKKGPVNEKVERVWKKIIFRKDTGLLLDHCCGVNTIKKETEYFGYEWVGLDHAGDIATVLGDACILPFDTDTFDIVHSEAVMEHVYDPWMVVEEVKRVLKKDGIK